MIPDLVWGCKEKNATSPLHAEAEEFVKLIHTEEDWPLMAAEFDKLKLYLWYFLKFPKHIF